MANIRNSYTPIYLQLSLEVVEEYGITIVPLSVMVMESFIRHVKCGQGDPCANAVQQKSSKDQPTTCWSLLRRCMKSSRRSSYRFDSYVSCLVRNRRGSLVKGQPCQAEVTVIDSGFTDQAREVPSG